MDQTILDSEYPEQSATIDISGVNDYPSLLTRVKSAIIDYLLILVVFLAASQVFSAFPAAPVWTRILVFIGMVYIYEPLLTSVGCTLGQLIMGIRVRSIDDTKQKINILFSVFRYLTKCILWWLSFITISFTGNKRAIHDMVGRSIVIYNEKKPE